MLPSSSESLTPLTIGEEIIVKANKIRGEEINYIMLLEEIEVILLL